MKPIIFIVLLFSTFALSFSPQAIADPGCTTMGQPFTITEEEIIHSSSTVLYWAETEYTYSTCYPSGRNVLIDTRRTLWEWDYENELFS